MKAIFGPNAITAKLTVVEDTTGPNRIDFDGLYSLLHVEERAEPLFVAWQQQPYRTRPTVTVTMERLEGRSIDEIEEANFHYGLREQPDEIKDVIKALFQIEQGMPRDREAIVEVEPGSDGPKFVVTTRLKDYPDPPDNSDWYKRWVGGKR